MARKGASGVGASGSGAGPGFSASAEMTGESGAAPLGETVSPSAPALAITALDSEGESEALPAGALDRAITSTFWTFSGSTEEA